MLSHERARASDVERLRKEARGAAIETLELPLAERNSTGEDYARRGVRTANRSSDVQRVRRAKVEIDEHEVDVVQGELGQESVRRIEKEGIEASASEPAGELERCPLGLREEEDAVHDDGLTEQEEGQS